MKIGDIVEVINGSSYIFVHKGEKYKIMSFDKRERGFIEVAGVKNCNSNGGYFIRTKDLKLIKQIIQIY